MSNIRAEDVLAAVYGIVAELREAGVVPDRAMRHFDALCLPAAGPRDESARPRPGPPAGGNTVRD
jgi:hypothetical protein